MCANVFRFIAVTYSSAGFFFNSRYYIIFLSEEIRLDDAVLVESYNYECQALKKLVHVGVLHFFTTITATIMIYRSNVVIKKI